MVKLRTVYSLLAGKWCLAFALLFALTLPITTCQSKGKVQEHHVEIAADHAGMILCFAWPVPFLLLRTGWRKARLSYALAFIESNCAVVAGITLTAYIAGTAIISIGFISPGRGYQLAASSLLGYLVLSLFDFAVLFANRPQPRWPVLQPTDATSEPDL